MTKEVIGISLLVVVLVIGLSFVGRESFWNRNRLYENCLRDGVAEYDCYAKIYGRGK